MKINLLKLKQEAYNKLASANYFYNFFKVDNIKKDELDKRINIETKFLRDYLKAFRSSYNQNTIDSITSGWRTKEQKEEEIRLYREWVAGDIFIMLWRLKRMKLMKGE